MSGYGRTKDEWVPDRLHYGRFSVGAAKQTSLGITGKDNSAAVCEGIPVLLYGVISAAATNWSESVVSPGRAAASAMTMRPAPMPSRPARTT